MSQLALPLHSLQANEPGRIIVGNGNKATASALANPADWPFRSAVLVGPARSGKSLLGRWFSAHGKGATIDGANSWDEAELFHRWNRAQECGEAILLISDVDPWEITLPDLRSRIGGSLHLEIGVPDDHMVADLLIEHAERRSLSNSEAMCNYLLPRIERDYASIERVVAEIDRISLERKVPATMSIWRDALDAVQGPDQARLL